MEKLYLDIDDTLLDTEKYLRLLLKNNFISCPENSSVYELRGDVMAGCIVEEMLSSEGYEVIPFVNGGEDGIELLKSEYEVVLVSDVVTSDEGVGKTNLAKRLGCDIILTGDAMGRSKSDIDMSDGVFVDNMPSNLFASNAKRRILMFSEYDLCYPSERQCFSRMLREDSVTVIGDFYDLVDLLIGVDESDAELRERVYQGIQKFCKNSGI